MWFLFVIVFYFVFLYDTGLSFQLFILSFIGSYLSFYRLVVLITFLTILSILSRTLIPRLLKLMISLSSQVMLHLSKYVARTIFGYLTLSSLQTNELYQLASVAFCLLVAWVRCTSQFFLLTHLNGIWSFYLIKFSTSVICQEILIYCNFTHFQSFY